MGSNPNARRPNGVRKWYDLKVAKRIPELEMERKMTDIRREQACLKRDRRLEENEMWQDLFENHNQLEKSIAKFPLKDVQAGVVPLVDTRERMSETEEETSRSEKTRAFFNYKSTTMKKLFNHQAPKRPSYRDLYRRQYGRKEVNSTSYKNLMAKFEGDDSLRKFSMAVEFDPSSTSQTKDLPSLTYVTASRAVKPNSASKRTSQPDL